MCGVVVPNRILSEHFDDWEKPLSLLLLLHYQCYKLYGHNTRCAMHRSIGSLRKFWHISHKSDEREEELLKFLNNVNCESWHFGNIWYNYKTRISDPIFCRRFIPFQKEFQVKDWDLRLFNCDILKKTWIISGLEPDGGKEIANWFLCSGICLLVQTADAAVLQ